ncbi:MAG: glycosyltransferase family 39 protein [Deltaproteobacteria bacterium]|nr:glycosyltransferase family 39 protein [Deltaproteobacteria bacterium]
MKLRLLRFLPKNTTFPPNSKLVVGGVWIALALIVGSWLRIQGVFCTEFWLDEIWSLTLAERLTSFTEVFQTLTSDNNHILNTLFLYFLGDAQPWFWYRLPALICGITILPLAAAAEYRRGPASQVIAVTLFSFSFLMVLYSSEARGYSPMLLSVVLCTYLLEKHLETGSKISLWLFNLGVVLGFLSHFSFILFYAGALSWSGFVLLRPRLSAAAIGRMLKLHALPLALVSALYFGHIRFLTPGSSDLLPRTEIVLTAISLVWGGPVFSRNQLELGAVGLLLVAALVTMTAGELRRLAKAGDHRWIFFLTTLLIAPAGVLIIFEPRVLSVRYFLSALACFYFLAAGMLAYMFRRGGAERGIALVMLGVFMAGNIVHLWHFSRDGRGHFKEALTVIANSSSEGQVCITSDQDFRHEMLLNYYRPQVQGAKRIRYTAITDSQQCKAQWFIKHSPDRNERPPQSFSTPDGMHYQLAATYRHATQSGWSIFLYRNRSRLE